VHNSRAGVRSATLRSHLHVSRTDYTMAVLSVTVLGLRPQSSETTHIHASVNGSRALTTGAARPSNINLYVHTVYVYCAYDIVLAHLVYFLESVVRCTLSIARSGGCDRQCPVRSRWGR